jgi:hypothetical protein
MGLISGTFLKYDWRLNNLKLVLVQIIVLFITLCLHLKCLYLGRTLDLILVIVHYCPLYIYIYNSLILFFSLSYFVIHSTFLSF